MINLKNLLSESNNTDPLYILAYSKDEKAIRDALRYFQKSYWTKFDIQRAVEKYKNEHPQKVSSINVVQSTNWNPTSYKKWIKQVASNGGKNHSYDMAQNAKHESGLMDYVKKQIRRDGGDETALERIQWDIEAN